MIENGGVERGLLPSSEFRVWGSGFQASDCGGRVAGLETLHPKTSTLQGYLAHKKHPPPRSLQ